MARARGANAILAAAFEDTYGTAPTTGYQKLPFVSSALGDEQDLIASDILGYGREPLAPALDVVKNSGDVVVPVDVRNFGTWLKLLLGAPTTTGTTPAYTHVFSSGASSLPSMSAEIGLPDIPSYGMNSGIRANTCKITMQRSGLLNATMSLIAQGETKATTSSAGSPTTAAVTRFSQFLGAVKKDSVALAHVVSADFSYTNNLDTVETIRSDGKIEDADPAMVGLTGNVTVRFADTTLLDQATSGDPCALSFGWTIDASNSLLFSVPVVYLPKAKTPVDGPGGIQAQFAWQASRDTGTGKTCTVTLVNDVAIY